MSDPMPTTADGGESTLAPKNRPESASGSESASKPEAPSILPEGRGLKLGDVRELLHNVHKRSVPQHDEILMVVTVCNAFLEEVEALHQNHKKEVEKLQQRHEEGLSRLMADKAGSYVANITNAVDKLSEGLSSASAEGMRLAAGGLEKRLVVFRTSLSWLAAIVCVSALINVIAFALLAVR